ncbi:hypothetical protein ACFYVR_18135 [Rhodococcus sp. NPDC003318]|uniref:hypothetical protein n=1 Tax=Rhodococcus sp. NPDC003318 TaxID=3364503 RepID=UPI0036BF31B5
MLILTLALAAVGFALLVVALMTGSVVWAWGCIVVCVIGAVVLLVSSLRGTAAPTTEPGSGAPGPDTTSGRFDGSD